jgi:sugar phosphate isomerase/epimerase
MTDANLLPRLHNAMWPALVGKGPGAAEPAIDLDTMLTLTARARAGALRFEGVDLFVAAPHLDIDASRDDLVRLAQKVGDLGLVVGSLVAPVWAATGGGSAMGSRAERDRFVTQVRKTCVVATALRELGVRPCGVVRIDSACSPAEWARDPQASQARIAETFRAAADVAADHGERLAAEGEVCWGGMHGWRTMIDLLERVDRPGLIGFQADMAHTLLYTLGVNAPDQRILPADWDWKDAAVLDAAIARLAQAFRPWILDVHIAQNDGTVHGSGSHDRTGRHCAVDDPAGRLDIPRHARHWLRDPRGQPTPHLRHVCWDACMLPNRVLLEPRTWERVLAAMGAVRAAHGWGH